MSIPSSDDRTVAHAAEWAARRSSCSIACALDIVGDRWTLLVIRDLIARKSRYSDFRRSAEHIPTNILANRLRLLERAGLIEGVPYGERSRRRAYRLTADGWALGEVVDALATWGLQHLPGTIRGVWPEGTAPADQASAPLRPSDEADT